MYLNIGLFVTGIFIFLNILSVFNKTLSKFGEDLFGESLVGSYYGMINEFREDEDIENGDILMVILGSILVQIPLLFVAAICGLIWPLSLSIGISFPTIKFFKKRNKKVK